MIDRIRRAATAAFAVLLAIAVAPEDASAASPEDKAAAESLFDSARALMAQGKFVEACPKLAESQRLDPTLGTLLNLATCHEGEGKTASAWAEFKEVAVLASKRGQADRLAIATEHVERLEEKLARLKIDVTAEVPGLHVTRDGEEIGRAAFGIPIALDPGAHRVVATAPGHVEFSARITLRAEGGTETVTIPKLEPEARAMRAAGFALGGLGVASLITGAVLGGVAWSEVNRLKAGPCRNDVCISDTAWAQRNTAEAMAKASTLTIGVGAAVTVAGTLLYVVSRPKPYAAPASARWSLSPIVTARGAAISLVGAFE